jgi:general secretion pathway protein B
MSFILNALRKSELEREAAQTKPLSNKLMSQPPTTSIKNNNSIWLILLALVNLCFLAVVMWYFFEKGSDEDRVEEQPLIMTEKLIEAEPTQPTLLQTETVKIAKIEKPPAPVHQPVKTVPQQSIAQQLKHKFSPVPQAKKVAPSPPPANIVPQESFSQTFNSRLAPENSTQAKIITETPVIQEQDVAEENNIPALPIDPISTQKNNSNSEPNHPPFLSELAYKDRRAIPNVSINVFVYSNKEKERFIMVDMTKYITGQEIKDGMILKEIRKNSVVIEYEDQIFQVKR